MMNNGDAKLFVDCAASDIDCRQCSALCERTKTTVWLSAIHRIVPFAAQRAPASLTLHYVPGKSFRFTIFVLLALRQ